jgi:hypothetical protein
VCKVLKLTLPPWLSFLSLLIIISRHFSYLIIFTHYWKVCTQRFLLFLASCYFHTLKGSHTKEKPCNALEFTRWWKGNTHWRNWHWSEQVFERSTSLRSPTLRICLELCNNFCQKNLRWGLIPICGTIWSWMLWKNDILQWMMYPFLGQELLILIPLNMKVLLYLKCIFKLWIIYTWWWANNDKGGMLQSQSKNMTTMAFHLNSTSKIWDAFLVGQVKINNEWKNKVNINNLKTIKDLSVVSKKKFRSKCYNNYYS